MTRQLILTLCVAVSAPYAVATSVAQAQGQGQSATNRMVRFAGTLTDAAGAPLTGTQSVTFTLFDAGEGGTSLWTETLTVNADERGRYAVVLGSTAALPQDVFASEQARWVGTTVSGRELERSALVSVPYALKAVDADTLGGKPASSFVTTNKDGKLQRADGMAFDSISVDGSGVPGQIAKWANATTLSSSVISESASNRVGFGLTDPTGGGVVDSVFTIKNFDNNTGFSILNDAQQRRFAINTLTTGGWWMYDGGGNTWNGGLRQTGGNLGIGVAPLSYAKIHADQPDSNATAIRAFASGAGTNVVALYGDSSSGYGVYGSSNTGFSGFFTGAKSYMSQLGIGTQTPADLLDVNGDIRVGTGVTGCVKDSDGTPIAGICSSDFRFKKNIIPFGTSLERVSRLQPVYFSWRAEEFPDKHFGAARSFGLIAQDVEAILPELVVTDDNGFRAVKYNELPFHMLQAIKELKGENDALKQLLKSQEERLRKLEGAIK